MTTLNCSREIEIANEMARKNDTAYYVVSHFNRIEILTLNEIDRLYRGYPDPKYLHTAFPA